ncbi:MAG TPA: TonB-dependent receptor, partial [Stellaceae bacterium]|nr:TonB-dependent receptor [Stellaceae bacterium]
DGDFYDYKYYNLQDAVHLAGSSTVLIENAPEIDTKGVELSGAWKPRFVKGVVLHASGSYNDGTYVKFETGCYGAQTPALGCNLNEVAGAFSNQSLAGKRLQNDPEWAGDIGVSYDGALGGTSLLYGLTLDAAYASGYQSDPEFDPRGMQDPAWLLNASVNVYTDDDAWSVGVIGRNLTNVIRVTQTDTTTFSALGTGTPFANPTDTIGWFTPPREVIVQLTYRFGHSQAAVAETAPPVPAPAPAAPPPVAAPEAARSFQVFFDFDKSDITAAAAKVIQAAADAVKAGHVVRITVTGHTDTVGTAPYNQGLSERRAASVKQGLVADGVDGSEISTVGVGKTGLLVPTADGVREPQNRRAEIMLQ